MVLALEPGNANCCIDIVWSSLRILKALELCLMGCTLAYNPKLTHQADGIPGAAGVPVVVQYPDGFEVGPPSSPAVAGLTSGFPRVSGGCQG